jgi:hypothetical protein
MSISASKQSLQIAKQKLSNFDENSVISFLIVIFRRLNCLSTPFYTPYVVHVDFSVETIPAKRKTQTFNFRRKLGYFVPDWDISEFKRSFHSILHAERSARQFQRRNNPCKTQNWNFQISTKTRLFRSWLRYFGVYTVFPLHSTRRTWRTPISESSQSLQIAKRKLSIFDENSVISFLIDMFRRLNCLSTPFYTPNVAHANFSVETIPANRKTETFKFRRKLGYFVPDCDISAFKLSFHSILHAERRARQFQRRNNPCKSQNANFQISVKTLLFRSWLRYFSV